MWDLKIIDTDKPLYIAIAEAIERDIRAGILNAGDKMPTHRNLANKVGVNVTTVTRAYKEAEKRNLISAIVGNGTFITSDMGLNSSLVDTDKDRNALIEMGLVLPLYSVEPDINTIIHSINNTRNLRMLMEYTPPQGLLYHRQTGANWVKQFGIDVSVESIIVTSGAQHAINCILSSVFEQGDCIAVDYLTYPGIKAAAKRCGIRLEGVMMDEQGMLPESLEAACKRHTIKGIYTVGNIQNPTNAIMSNKRIEEIARIIRKENIILIEDDLYGFLSLNNKSTLSAHLPDQSIYIAGISKAFYAGLRVGFIVTPKKFYNRIAQAVVDTVWMTSALSVEIACECINTGIADKIIRLKRDEIEKRARALAEKLQDYHYEYVQHSMFAWLKLPDYWTSTTFERIASDYGINVIAADKFTVGNIIPPNYVRISLSGADSLVEFREGLDILYKVLTGEYGSISRVL